LEHAVNRIGNHQLLGIGTPIAAGATKAVTGSNKLAAVAGLLKAVLDNPAVKSNLAIALKARGIGAQTFQSRLAGYIGALTGTASPFTTNQDIFSQENIDQLQQEHGKL
jgi:hypothetical protein